MFEYPNYEIEYSSELVQNCEQIVNSHIEDLKIFLKSKDKVQYDDIVSKLDTYSLEIHDFFGPISHLNSVMQNDDLRGVYAELLPLLNKHSLFIGQNLELYEKILDLKESQFDSLSESQKLVISNMIRDFRLTGVHLSTELKNKFSDLVNVSSELRNKFSNNVLDSMNASYYHESEVARLSGLSDESIASFADRAKMLGKNGYVIDLNMPNYVNVIENANNRLLRQKFFYMHNTVASDLSHDGKFDNTDNIYKILQNSQDQSELLGFNNYVEQSLAPKMASTYDQVKLFLTNIGDQAYPKALSDYQALNDHAQKLGIDQMQSWDVAYVSKKLKEEIFNIDENFFKKFFTVENVFVGLNKLLNDVFGLELKLDDSAPIWHPDVKFYQVIDNKSGKVIGGIYYDFFARPKKSSGAWMDICKKRTDLNLPIAYVVCNFTAPNLDVPSLLSHNEIVTLFHEMGHALHFLLTDVKESELGFEAVPWDAIEGPSQFLEQWAWDREILYSMSLHYQTGEKIDYEYIDNLVSSSKHMLSVGLIRQVTLGLFDIGAYKNYSDVLEKGINAYYQEILKMYPLGTIVDYARMGQKFTHIFSGGYASGYYSYLWAEVLAMDAFSAFSETSDVGGIGRKYRDTIWSKGASKSPDELFRDFRDRDPDIKYLLSSYGI